MLKQKFQKLDFVIAILIVPGMVLVAVSYTHLDVYKRQVSILQNTGNP